MPSLTAYPEQPTQPPHDGPTYDGQQDADALRDDGIVPRSLQPDLTDIDLAKARLYRVSREATDLAGVAFNAVADVTTWADEQERDLRIVESELSFARRSLLRLRGGKP